MARDREPARHRHRRLRDQGRSRDRAGCSLPWWCRVSGCTRPSGLPQPVTGSQPGRALYPVTVPLGTTTGLLPSVMPRNAQSRTPHPEQRHREPPRQSCPFGVRDGRRRCGSGQPLHSRGSVRPLRPRRRLALPPGRSFRRQRSRSGPSLLRQVTALWPCGCLREAGARTGRLGGGWSRGCVRLRR